jgi:uncharacterized protein YjbI with pentapeptide repeats
MRMREGEPMADVQAPVDEVQGAAKPVDGAKAAAPAAEMPPTAAAFAGKAKDLGALRDAVVDAANVGAGLWFSYLFVLLYLIVAVGGVTHRNLLFESPVKLPFLGVDLPLVGFFVLGPALFLIVHAYVLLHFAMLADKVGVFHAELQAQIADDAVRGRLRRQLPSNIFVQFLAGPIEVRSGLMGTMLRLIAQISLVAGPLALLVFFQLQFLPYHDEAVSWWQRIAVIADLVLLWALWPSVARGETSAIAWRDLRRPHVAAAAVASLVPILLVFTVATFPGEWLNRNPVSASIIPRAESASIRWITPHEFLVAGDIDLVAARPASVWSNRLVLPGLELKQGESVSLRGRNLEGAVLLGANLRKMDFTATSLRGAVLNGADLREAKFPCTDSRLTMEEDSSSNTRPGTEGENCPQLQNAFLVGARLEGAEFQNAQLQGAVLDKAELRGVSLDGAQLQGASLADTNLQGASLAGAKLEGAFLQGAKLQGAVLDTARLQGANLEAASLQGASFAFTGLQGATLRGANLGGALLEQTRLHGAVLDSASLRGASLQRPLVWRASAQAKSDPPLVTKPETARTPPEALREVPRHVAPPDCVGREDCDWTAERFAELKQLVLSVLPEGTRRTQALQRIARLDPDTPLPGEDKLAELWVKRAQSPPQPAAFERSLSLELARTGCAKDGAPYILRRWLDQFDQARLRLMADAVLREDDCPGLQSLSNDEKAALRAVAQAGAAR